MSATSNLDKGLDEIIAGTGISSGGRKPARASQGFKKARKGTSSKTLGKAIEAAASARANVRNNKQKGKTDKQNKGAAAAATQTLPAGLVSNPLDAAKRAVVSNLPLDVNEDAVRSYFSANVGKIRKVEGSFRGDGTPSGTYTITFDKNGMARKLFEKFNNQPIDGGKKHLVVQILLDPSAVPGSQNTLQGRIGTGSAAATANNNTQKSGASRSRKRNGAKAGDKGPLKATSTPAAELKKNAKAKKNAPKAKKPQRKARSEADLDAEMSDYFASAEKNEISV